MMEKQKKNIYCNCCGRRILEKENAEREEYLTVIKEWGFFSGKDGEIHRFTVCEACYDQWIRQFRIPVSVEEKTELL